MIPTETERAAHFSLITRAHRFLLTALPLRENDSAAALRDFVASVATIERVRTFVLDAVLIRLLGIIDQQTGRRIPTLLERYAAKDTFSRSACLRRFRACVEELLKNRGVGNRCVQYAVAVIDKHSSDPSLNLTTVARRVGRNPSTLCCLFKSTTGTTVHQYLRNVRLERAVELLATTDKSIKEVWSSVGYNHASDFDHHFKTRFGMSPSEYRSRATRVISSVAVGDDRVHPEPPVTLSGPDQRTDTSARVLLVDDDEAARTILPRYLKDLGYRIFTAESAAAGYAEARRVSPDLILLDFHLPDLDAIDFLRRMRRDTDDSHPPVIVFSADWNVEDYADELLSMNAVFVSKLCDLDDLVDIVRTRLQCRVSVPIPFASDAARSGDPPVM